MKKLILIIWTLLSFIYIANSQDIWANCLSGEHVNDLIETNSSIWIASSGGLIQYDKIAQKNTYYNRANSDIQSNFIESIELDKDNVLWMSSSSGLSSFKNNVWKHYDHIKGKTTLDRNSNIVVASTTEINIWDGQDFNTLSLFDSLNHLFISDVVINKTNDDIWVSAYTFGQFAVLKYSNNQITVYTHQNSILPFESPDGNNMVIDSDGILWLTTSNMLFQYDNTWINKTDLLPQNRSRMYRGLSIDENNTKYILSSDWSQNNERKILKLDSNEDVTEIIYPQRSTNAPTPIFTKKYFGKLYAGFGNQGCWQYTNDQWSKINTSENNFSSNQIRVSADQEGTIYVQSGLNGSSYDQNLFSFENKKWKDNSNVAPFHSENNRLRVLKGKNGESWMLYNKNLHKKINNSWIAQTIPDIAQDINEENSIVHFDHNGDMWLLEQYYSAIFYNKNGQWEHIEHEKHGARSGHYFSLFNHPSTNELWLSTYNGVSIYNYETESWQLIKLKDLGLSDNYATLRLDKNGEIWGVSRNVFFKMEDKENIEIITRTDSLGSKWQFTAIYAEGDSIWLGMNNVLAMYHNEQFTLFNYNNSGLSNGYVNSILKDDNGNYWIGSNEGGLSLYNPNGISKSILDKVNTSSIETIRLSPFTIYPNPAISSISIDISTDFGNYNLNIFNIEGKTIWSNTNFMGHQLIKLNNPIAGIYIVRITQLSSNNVYYKKLLID